MKMDFEQFQANAGADPKLPASGGEDSDEKTGESSGEVPMGPRGPSRPTFDWEIGPDGPTMGFSGPVEIDDPAEFFVKMMEVREEKSSPDLSEQVLELAKDPEVRQAARTVWFGPDNVESKPSPTRAESTTMDPTAELDPGEEPQAETDGGELREENIYEITPEGLVAVLQQQVAEVSALKPGMTLEELETFMEGNQERLVGEAEELLEALDSNG